MTISRHVAIQLARRRPSAESDRDRVNGCVVFLDAANDGGQHRESVAMPPIDRGPLDQQRLQHAAADLIAYLGQTTTNRQREAKK